jgi:hypothetical protein
MNTPQRRMNAPQRRMNAPQRRMNAPQRRMNDSQERMNAPRGRMNVSQERMNAPARLTNAFSRKRENLRAALALHFAAYNFTWMHRGIRMTPAMAAGIARKPWAVRDLLMAAAC